MLYIIGLGLNERGISKEGLLAIEKCKKIYLESYTVDFPYEIKDLKFGKKKIIKLGRSEVESDKLIKEARGRDIALLVYGSPLFATTHISLVLDAEKQKVKTKIIYSASVLDAVAETGLQLYKFGKIASMPSREDADFMEHVCENMKIDAHSLILVDIGLSFDKALEQLERAINNKNIKIDIDKLIVCSKLGTSDSNIIYDNITNLKKQKNKIQAPFCFIIPGKMHFLEKEGVGRFG